jgi:hypothetical protein
MVSARIEYHCCSLGPHGFRKVVWLVGYWTLYRWGVTFDLDMQGTHMLKNALWTSIVDKEFAIDQPFSHGNFAPRAVAIGYHWSV